MAAALLADKTKAKGKAPRALVLATTTTTVHVSPRLATVCTLWVHNDTFAKEPVLFNASVFAPDVIAKGQLIRVVPCKDSIAVHDFQQPDPQPGSSHARRDAAANSDALPSQAMQAQTANLIARRETPGDEGDEEKEDDDDNADDNQGGFLFRAVDLSVEHKAKHANLQISISSKIAKLFGFRNRSSVLVSTAREKLHSASHVEFVFRDVYLARGDMWRLAMSQLHDKPIYRGQRIDFLSTVKGTIKNIYFQGKKVESAVFSTTTKPIFRSESARFLIYIQMSKEMWEFDTEGSGDLMFEKAVEGFLPKLFKIWQSIDAHHLVSIILFTRMTYDNVPQRSPFDEPPPHDPDAIPTTKDFYRVVVSDMASGEWTTILNQLKKEFKFFQRDISLEKREVVKKGATKAEDVKIETFHWGHATTAMQGNILEAISLASTRFSKDYIDRDLLRTGISIIIITPGTGVFEVDEKMLKLTTDNLVNNGIGIDLVSLSPMPLHSTPLFKYRAKASQHAAKTKASDPFVDAEGSSSTVKSRLVPFKDEFTYAMPHWLDVSFWYGNQPLYVTKSRDPAAKAHHRMIESLHPPKFTPRARLYEVQMMGFMENEMTGIQIPYLHETNPLGPNHKDFSDPAWWDEYDEQVFAPIKPASEQRTDIPTESKTSKPYQRDNSTAGKFQSSAGDRLGKSPSTNSASPGNTYFDQQMKDRVKEGKSKAPAIDKPRPAAPVMPRDKPDRKAVLAFLNSALRNSELARSGGGVALDIKIAHRTPSQSERPPEPAATMQRDSASVSQQFLASLSRGRPAQQDSEESTDPPSMPISIQSAAKMTNNTADDGPAQVPSPLAVQSSADVPPLDVIQAASFSKSTGARLDLLAKTPPQHAVPLASDADEVPWLTIVNPCNPKENDVDVAKKFGRWQHVFPKAPKASAIKWKSLTRPAALPITTESLPTDEIFSTKYEEFPYKIVCNEETDVSEEPKNKFNLIRELIGFRLSHGFQIVVPPAASNAQESRSENRPAISRQNPNNRRAVSKHTPSTEFVDVFAEDFTIEEGASITMSKGSIVHELQSLANGEIQIIRKQRKSNLSESDRIALSIPYKAHIRTMLADLYEPYNAKLTQSQEEYNWSYIDNYLAGHTESLSESLRHWRTRLVLIPVEPRRPLPILTEDSDEEIRIEGIQKLTQVWQRYRIGLPGDYRFPSSTDRRRDPNPLAIEYQTRDPSKAIAAGLGSSKIVFADPNELVMQMSMEPKQHTTANMDIRTLATEIQGSRGIKIQDRRWHLRLHYDCFDGTDLTSWLLQNFKDLDTREDAIKYGNELMQNGLFQHVQKKHNFRDGNFFYSIAEDYRQPRPESRTGWFGTRKVPGSVPSTPMLEAVKSPATARTPDTAKSPSHDTTESPLYPSREKRPKVALSGVLQYDVDHRRRSYRPEIINLHYDRLHNPENCYHIRIDWMNVTAKLIEDAIVSWAMTSERYGLKLVELPIAEAATISETHPFRAPYILSLAIPPPLPTSSMVEPGAAVDPARLEAFETAAPETPSGGGVLFSERQLYQQALLKKFDFVLDIEAASNFPKEYDVTYSWGKPDYRFSQYVHRTGVLIAQITDEGDFLLVANRMFNNRAPSFASHETSRNDKKDRQIADAAKAKASSGENTLHGDSGVRAGVDKLQTAAGKQRQRTPEQLKDQLEEFCNDKIALEKFYEEVGKSLIDPAVPTVLAAPATREESIPKLELPATLEIAGDLKKPECNTE